MKRDFEFSFFASFYFKLRHASFFENGRGLFVKIKKVVFSPFWDTMLEVS